MTGRMLRLDDLGADPVRDGAAAALPPEELERIRLEAFEEGYKTGWEDCAASELETRRRIGEDLARSLQDLSFSYSQARAEVLAGLRPLLDGLVEGVLPALAAQAIGPLVRDELAAALDAIPPAGCEITAAPGTCEILEPLLPELAGATVTLRAEPAYSDSHVTLRFGAEMREIDLGAACAEIAAAITGFVDPAAEASPIPKTGAVR